MVLVNKPSLAINNLEESKQAEMANRATDKVKYKTTVDIVILNDRNALYRTECRVIENHLKNVILGIAFLINNDATIKSNKKYMSLMKSIRNVGCKECR